MRINITVVDNLDQKSVELVVETTHTIKSLRANIALFLGLPPSMQCLKKDEVEILDYKDKDEKEENLIKDIFDNNNDENGGAIVMIVILVITLLIFLIIKVRQANGPKAC